MAATAGAVLNGLGSSFMCGGRRSQALLGIGASRSTGSFPVGTRKLVVVAAAAQPKKSWIPAVKGGGNLVDPEWLDGSLPGDYGFDPLGLGKDPAFLKWYREAELIHGRWAMAAVLAHPHGLGGEQEVGGLLQPRVPIRGVGNAMVEERGEFRQRHRRPGVSPAASSLTRWGLAGTLKDGVYIPDVEKLERLKVAEIKHARLAMVAMLIFYFEAGQGKTPLGALGL
ncbi:hypothetical protein OIU76_018658 [Salix suchowensis]|nr:hypothetical protein OIU76_018658 [Salix suchowensis]